MFNRVNYTLVGLFVVVLGVALVAAGLWFTVDLGGDAEQRYLVLPEESLTGLSRNSAVKYQGIDVGRVRELGLDDRGRVRVVIGVSDRVPVRADTRVRLASQGLTGLGHLELLPGSADAPPATADRFEYPVLPNAPSLRTRLESAVEDGLASLDRMAEQLQRLLSDDNIHTLSATAENLETVTAVLADNSAALETTLGEAGGLIRETRTLVGDAPATLARVEATLERFDRAAASIERLGGSLEATGAEGTAALERVRRETLPELHGLLLDARELTRNAERLTRDLGDEPDRLLFGPRRRAPGPGERE